MAYKETAEHNRVTLFEEALNRATEQGYVWNDLSGENRDAIVRSIEEEWEAADRPAE